MTNPTVTEIAANIEHAITQGNKKDCQNVIKTIEALSGYEFDQLCSKKLSKIFLTFINHSPAPKNIGELPSGREKNPTTGEWKPLNSNASWAPKQSSKVIEIHYHMIADTIEKRQ